jgi:hypothetical protein
MRNLISSIGVLTIALTVGACSTAGGATPDRDGPLNDSRRFEALPQNGQQPNFINGTGQTMYCTDGAPSSSRCVYLLARANYRDKHNGRLYFCLADARNIRQCLGWHE